MRLLIGIATLLLVAGLAGCGGVGGAKDFDFNPAGFWDDTQSPGDGIKITGAPGAYFRDDLGGDPLLALHVTGSRTYSNHSEDIDPANLPDGATRGVYDITGTFSTETSLRETTHAVFTDATGAVILDISSTSNYAKRAS